MIRQKDGDAIQGMVTIQAADAGGVEAVRADLDYLLDLLDRVVSAGENGLEKTTQVNARQP